MTFETLDEVRRALGGLVEAVRHGGGDDRQKWVSWLSLRSGPEWLALDDNARSCGQAGAVVAGAGWPEPGDAGDDGLLADGVGSWHVDGHLRERSTRRLAGRSGQVAAAGLAVRCLDHVQQVREVALAGLLRRTDPDDVVGAVAVLTAGHRRHGAPAVLQACTDSVLSVPGAIGAVLRWMNHRDRRIRRWAAMTALDRDLLPTEAVLELVRTDADQLVRARAAEWLLDGAPEVLGRLLRVRFVEARLVALQHLSDEDLSNAQLQAALLDPSSRVRAVAQDRSRRRGLDAAGTYRTHLADGSPRIRAAALAGLAAVGRADDVPRIVALTTDDRPVVRAAALGASAALAAPEETVARAAPFLDDSSRRVIAAAARALIRVEAGPEVTAAAWTSSRVASRVAAWKVQRARGGWDRLEADLRAASDLDGLLARDGRTAARAWLRTSAARMWTPPTPSRQATLTGLLSTSGLADTISGEIAFHIGPVDGTAASARGEGSRPESLVHRRWWHGLRRRREG